MSTDKLMMLKDENVQLFLTETANSLIKLDLIIYFHDKSSSWYDLEEISVFMGRSIEVLDSELEELVLKGIIEKSICSQKIKTVYRYGGDESTRKRVDSFISSYNDYIERLKIICTLLKNDSAVKNVV
ncbi:MAG: hypothetical protein PHD91_03180 [bacterium]|jgi:hypothetical protein|nr:hypothetical protein [bacterium]MDD3805236.1 hypothetical protein [bacterium]MDD4152707.1 hypothetical protein [bacterium]MDD4558281.1 hypothetical protein [bacterium]